MLVPKKDLIKIIDKIVDLLNNGTGKISKETVDKYQRCYKAFMEYEDAYDQWHKARILSIDQLYPIVAILNKHCRNVNISKLVGSSVGVAGGVAIIVGLALVPFTAGISLGVTAAGITAGIAGGVTSAGAQLAQYGLAKSEMNKIQGYLDDDCRKLTKLQPIIHELREEGTELYHSREGDTLGHWRASDISTMFGTITRTTGATITGRISGGVATTAALGGSALVIAAHTVSAAVIAIDVGIIGFTAYDMVKGSPSRAKKKVKQMKEQLEEIEKFNFLMLSQ